MQTGEETENQAAGESQRFALDPGVYQARIHATIAEDADLFINVENDGSRYKALRCNGAVMWGGQEYMDFEVYVLSRTDASYFVWSGEGPEGAISIDFMELYRCNIGERIFAFCCLMLFTAVNGLLAFRKGILQGRISKKSQAAFWLLAFGVFISYFPYITDYMTMGADAYFHLLRIEGLKETLLHGGQFPVRVQDYWLRGHGYATSLFYGDLFIMIPTLLRLIGFSIMTSYKMFILTIMIATAGVSYYSFKKCTGDVGAATVGSLFYVLAPYRIYDIFNRAAIGEALAMIFLPLVLSGLYRIYHETNADLSHDISAQASLIIGITGILQSHLLTTEMAVVGMLCVCLIFYKKTFRKRIIKNLGISAVICLLLNCWFWLPMLWMMRQDRYKYNTYVDNRIQEMGTSLAGVFQLYPNRGGYQIEMFNCEPIQLGIAGLVVLILFIVLRVKRKTEKDAWKNPYDRILCWLAGLTIFSLFLSTRYFPWDFLAKLPVVRIGVTSLQFPTRFLSPTGVFGAAAAAFFVLWIREERRHWPAPYAKGIVKGGMFTILLLLFGSAVYYADDFALETAPYWIYTAENMGSIGIMLGEYIPEGASTEGMEYTYHAPVAEEGLEYSSFEKNGLQMKVYVNNPAAQEKYLELPVIGYKGYGIREEKSGTNSPYVADTKGSHGDLKIIVPAGYQGMLYISYMGFPVFRVSEVVSLLTGLMVGLYLLKWRVYYGKKVEGITV